MRVQATRELAESDSKKLFLRNFPPGSWVGCVVRDVNHSHNVLDSMVSHDKTHSERMK